MAKSLSVWAIAGKRAAPPSLFRQGFGNRQMRQIFRVPSGQAVPIHAGMNKHYIWDSYFVELFDACVDEYDDGNKDYESWFSDEDQAFLKAIGCREREFFDFVEDNVTSGGEDPTAITALLVAAVRRDYFLTIQKGVASEKVIIPSDLPAKSAELEGFVWLPRIIAKANAKLRGEMDPDTMFGCGGDRAFLSKHDIHPADFLRVVWAADGDDSKIVAYVKSRQG